jgi:hypothetical protein
MQWREPLDKKDFAAGPTAGRILGYKGHVPGKQNQVGVASNEYDASLARAQHIHALRTCHACACTARAPGSLVGTGMVPYVRRACHAHDRRTDRSLG